MIKPPLLLIAEMYDPPFAIPRRWKWGAALAVLAMAIALWRIS